MKNQSVQNIQYNTFKRIGQNITRPDKVEILTGLKGVRLVRKVLYAQ